ncbi:MAG: hypothetical protein GYB64_16410 [Chloroflexi bacterium]|nr:hypothetical protein [Chloroflexota bacterium]
MRFWPCFLLTALLAACSAGADADGTQSAADLQPTFDARFTEIALTGVPGQDDPDLAATLATPLSEVDFENEVDQRGAGPERTPTSPPTAANSGPGTTGSGGVNPGGNVLPPATPAGNVPGERDGGDGYATSFSATISYGETVNGQLPTDIEAHNWNFTGSAGDSITIRVEGDSTSDPRVKLIGPEGFVLVERDGSGVGGSETISLTLNSSGLHTIRIDMWEPGGYTLTLTTN